MAEATRVRRTRTRKSEAPSNNGTFSLKTEPSTPVETLDNYAILLHGQPKIGKTTLCAQFPKPYFLMFEQGVKSLSVYYDFIKDWETVSKILNALVSSDFRTIVWDTMAKACELNQKHVLTTLGLDEIPGDYGKTPAKIRASLLQEINKAQSMEGVGSVFIAHSIRAERENFEGEEVESIYPDLPGGKTEKAILGDMDIMVYYCFHRGQRCLQIVGDDEVTAGHRVEGKFLTTKGDELKYIPMGTTSQQSYENFVRAFNNEIKPQELDFLSRRKQRDD